VQVERSTDRILTTHVGSLARPHELLDVIRAREHGADYDRALLDQLTREAVSDVVRRQVVCGVDVVADGEQSKLGFFQYLAERLDGLETRPGRLPLPPSWQLEFDQFPDYYAHYLSKYSAESGPSPSNGMVCTGPIRYIGGAAVARDIDNLETAMEGLGVREAFMPASAPHAFGTNEHYASTEDYAVAIADALRHEYRAIVAAGLILQVDDPFLIDVLMEEPNARCAGRRAREHVELVNHALRGIPPERVRYHACYGINHGPRLHDVPFSEVVDLMLSIDAGAYSFEAGNPRHEHEWRVWQDSELPEGKILIPGFLCHAHNFVEHPQLIADRIVTYAELVGRENVIAGADCGFSSRAVYEPEVHPTVVWAKLEALVRGARIASEALWPEH
jgi:5-methyltetrahydropteroyltriglutamate--homocysteine methyltransferase